VNAYHIDENLCGKKLATENNVSFYKVLLLLLYAREYKTKCRYAISLISFLVSFIKVSKLILYLRISTCAIVGPTSIEFINV